MGVETVTPFFESWKFEYQKIVTLMLINKNIVMVDRLSGETKAFNSSFPFN